jgi:hypothetical protein
MPNETPATEVDEPSAADAGDPTASPADGSSDETGSNEPIELPQRFSCGFRLGLAVGGATLVVESGVLRLYPDGSLQQHDGALPVEHIATAVRLFTPMWQPPTSNTGLVLEDDHSDRVALADLAAWHRTRLRAALTTAGFEVDEAKGGFDIGRSLVRPSASPWPRWFQKLWSKDREILPRR